jgi:predicted pyridoxine 5'-phosphate oxidase superfamily flavin-nucleotide-binding protein
VEGKVPRLGIIVDVEEAYTQCSKALIRSDLWNPARFIERSALPSNGEIHHLLSRGTVDAEKYDAERAARYARREGFY